MSFRADEDHQYVDLGDSPISCLAPAIYGGSARTFRPVGSMPT